MIKLISGYLGLDYPKLMGRRLDSFRQRVHSRHIFTQNNILILKQIYINLYFNSSLNQYNYFKGHACRRTFK